MNINTRKLRIKAKHLAEEARIIRREAQKTSGMDKWDLNHHRTATVRNEARATQLAYQFLLGKYLGLIMTLTIMLILMSLMFILVLIIHSVPVEWGMFIAVAFILLELFLITAVAMFFSCFPTPILSIIFSLAFYLIGHLSWGLDTVIQKMQPGPGKILSQVFFTFLPDLENFNYKTEVVHHLPVLPQIYLFSTVYGIAYILFVLAAAMLVFKKRDFI